MKPLITVIVPVYNGQDYLLKCINCIQDQTYENVEIIVVDDGSKDETPKICRALEAQFADGVKTDDAGRKRSFKCITLGDEGVSIARNSALAQSAGEYVSFVDADDRIAPDMLERLYETSTKYGSDVAGCRFFMWSDEEQWAAHIVEVASMQYEVKKYEPREYLHQEILRGNTRCWSKLYRRRAFEGVTFEPGLSIGEDMLFLVKLMEHAGSICEIDWPGYGYYQNAAGAMKRKFTVRVMDQIYCWEKARNVIGASPEVDRHIVISTMLVVGRLSGLCRRERKTYAVQAACCRQKLKEYLSREVFDLLDRGYKVKTLFYLLAPGIYMELYHRWKKG